MDRDIDAEARQHRVGELTRRVVDGIGDLHMVAGPKEAEQRKGDGSKAGRGRSSAAEPPSSSMASHRASLVGVPRVPYVYFWPRDAIVAALGFRTVEACASGGLTKP